MFEVKNRDFIAQMQDANVETGTNLKDIPETPEEAEIFMDANIKTSAEIAAQVGTNITLDDIIGVNEFAIKTDILNDKGVPIEQHQQFRQSIGYRIIC